MNCGPRGKNVAVYSLHDNRREMEPELLLGHSKTAYAIAASVGRLATGSDDRTVKLWDTLTAEALCTIDTGAKVWALAISASGDLLVSGGAGNSVGDIHVWDLRNVPADDGDPHYGGDPHTGQFDAARLASLDGPPSCTRSLTFDGDRVVAGGDDGHVRVWQHPAAAWLEIMRP